MSRHASRWKLVRRGLALVFFVAVGVLLFQQARQVEWAEVGAAMRRTDPLVLALAVLLAAGSYLLYASYDLLARRYTGHHLKRRKVVLIALISYAFNLNMGALVGGAGFRFRLYSRFGLPAGTIARILTFSVATNWGGYVLLGGLLLALQWLPMSLQWKLGSNALQGIGFLMLAAAAAYPLLCRFSRRRSFRLRGHELRLPGWRMALAQVALSTLNWMTIAAIVFVLLPAGVSYPTVLGVLLAAAVAGAVTHVPAGLGVLEAVFVMALSSRLGTPPLLAALLAYRAIYYLGPLLLAVPSYLLMERLAHRRGRPEPAGAPASRKKKDPGVATGVRTS